MIQAKDIHKYYGKTEVLKGVNLTVNSGEIYGLVGKNGAGKTTLLNIMSGIIEATTGACILDGYPLDKGAFEKGQISYLPDLPHFYDYLTVAEYLLFLQAAKKRDAMQTNRVQQYIDYLNLDKKAKIKNLSRGNRQKLGILSAMAGNQKVLLLDEPTSALDPLGRKDVMSLIKILKQQGSAIIFSTHILADLQTICDRVGFLHHGVIAREIDLNVNTGEQLTYEIAFESMEDSVLSLLSSRFTDFHMEVADNTILISCAQDTGKGQEYIFSSLSDITLPIKSVKKIYQHNLESIMEEVLAK